MIDRSEIGNRLRRLRKGLDKSLVEASKAIGISRSALQMYETGCRIPKDDIKIKLAEYYGLSVQDLFFFPSLSPQHPPPFLCPPPPVLPVNLKQLSI